MRVTLTAATLLSKTNYVTFGFKKALDVSLLNVNEMFKD